MIILDNNDLIVKSARKMLIVKFDMKNLDVVDILLVIRTSRTFNGLLLFQILLC